jgi:hypothetical protein
MSPAAKNTSSSKPKLKQQSAKPKRPYKKREKKTVSFEDINPPTPASGPIDNPSHAIARYDNGPPEWFVSNLERYQQNIVDILKAQEKNKEVQVPTPKPTAVLEEAKVPDSPPPPPPPPTPSPPSPPPPKQPLTRLLDQQQYSYNNSDDAKLVKLMSTIFPGK